MVLTAGLFGPAPAGAYAGSDGLTPLVTSLAIGTEAEEPRVAIVGDSYISGEGLFSYEDGTNVHSTDPSAKNLCHRSRQSWAYQYALKLTGGDVNRILFTACSGATANDIADGRYNETRGSTVGSQLERIQAFQPDIVLLSIGGNDAGFERIIASCLRNFACDYEVRGRPLYNAAPVEQAVGRAIDQIRSAVDDVAIYQMGYPSPLVPATDPCADLRLFTAAIDKGEQEGLHERFVAPLNDSLREVAESREVQFYNPLFAFHGHGICAEEPYAHGLIGGDDIPIYKGQGLGRESFHPNFEGHQALLRIAETHLRPSTPPDDSTGPTPPDDSTGPTPPDDSTGRSYLGYSEYAAALSEGGQWFTYVQSRQVDGVQYFDLWLRSTLSGSEPIRISKNADGTVTGGVQKYDAPGISDDGRYVVFSSYKPLTPDDTNSTGDVYRYDRLNDTLTLVPGTTSARSGPVSNDGRYIIILRPTSTSPLFGALWRVDMTTGLAVRVDTTATGANPDRTVTFLEGVQIFGDGGRVLFSTSAGNLDPADTDTVADLYVKDLSTGFVEAITAGLRDAGERLTSYRGGTISGDGRLLAFPAGGVLDGQWRQLLLDRSTGEHIVVAPGSNPLRVSADGSTLAYTINHVVPGTPGVDGSPSSGYTAAHRGTVVLSPLSVVDDVNLSLNADGSEPRFSNSTPSASIVGLSATGKELVWFSTYGYMMPDVYSGGGFFLDRAA